jgi:uncharacterized membrane protein
MPNKFDTNPLDPDFPEKARAATTASQKTPFATAEFPLEPGSVTEEETRRFQDSDFQAYSYSRAAVPAVYQAPAMTADMNFASDRKIATTGLPEKWLIALPYIPFSLGLIAGIILLLIMPKTETKVRFHAAQGLAAHIGILIVSTILGIVDNITDLAEVGGIIFGIVTTIMLIVFAIKAFKGKPIHIESVDDLTNWLEEKIGPIKS